MYHSILLKVVEGLLIIVDEKFDDQRQCNVLRIFFNELLSFRLILSHLCFHTKLLDGNIKKIRLQTKQTTAKSVFGQSLASYKAG